MDFLSKLTAPGLQVTGYAQGLIHFRCAKELQPNIEVEGQASLPGGVRCDLTVVVQQRTSGEYVAKAVGPPQSLTLLEKIFVPAPGAKEPMFYKPNDDDMTRHARTYVVRGGDLPNSKGATAELSRAGALVMLTGPLDAGKAIPLQIELDEVATIPVEAIVEWCTQRDQKIWIASLHFKPLEPPHDAALANFLETLKKRA